MDPKAQLSTWLEELLADETYAHAFLVDLNVLPNARVEIFLDSDVAVDLALCQRVSRHLEERIEATPGLMPEKYTIEVSSPGVKRAMTRPRQFGKHIGRTLLVDVDGERKVEGTLAEATPEGIVLTEEVVTKENNKKVKQTLRHEFAFGSFRGATVQVSFK